jgi:hypothetical protein
MPSGRFISPPEKKRHLQKRYHSLLQSFSDIKEAEKIGQIKTGAEAARLSAAAPAPYLIRMQICCGNAIIPPG